MRSRQIEMKVFGLCTYVLAHGREEAAEGDLLLMELQGIRIGSRNYLEINDNVGLDVDLETV